MYSEIPLLSTTLTYAKMYGVYFLVTGLALLINPSRFRSWYEDILSEGRRVVFGGVIALLIGSVILATHHYTELHWPIIITLIGYWGVVVGGCCMAFDSFIDLFKPMIRSSDMIYRISGVAWLLLGLFLMSKGF